MGDGTKTITDPPANVQWDPYYLWEGDTCSAVGDIEEVRARAQATLESQTSDKIESILWTNLVDGADFGASHPNVGLGDASLINGPVQPTQAQIDAGYIWQPNGTVSYPLVTAWRDLLDAMVDQLGGARGMIHVEKRLIADIVYTGLAIRNGDRLLTTDGDYIVVPGTGYTGSSPEGDAATNFHSWMYGTSMVEVLLGPIDVFGDERDWVNRTTNVVNIRAERMALAHWDRQCHVAIPVCLEDPFGDCSDAGS